MMWIALGDRRAKVLRHQRRGRIEEILRRTRFFTNIRHSASMICGSSFTPEEDRLIAGPECRRRRGARKLSWLLASFPRMVEVRIDQIGLIFKARDEFVLSRASAKSPGYGFRCG